MKFFAMIFLVLFGPVLASAQVNELDELMASILVREPLEFSREFPKRVRNPIGQEVVQVDFIVRFDRGAGVKPGILSPAHYLKREGACQSLDSKSCWVRVKTYATQRMHPKTGAPSGVIVRHVMRTVDGRRFEGLMTAELKKKGKYWQRTYWQLENRKWRKSVTSTGQESKLEDVFAYWLTHRDE